MALIEKRERPAVVNSAAWSNSQTLHFGDIETNYELDKSRQVKAAADLERRYLERHDEAGEIHSKYHKMVLAVGREDGERLRSRIKDYKELFPKLELIERERIGLGWAAGNLDPEVFQDPEEIQLDRKPNPHLSFGFGKHLCLGAPHARLIVRSLLNTLAAKVGSVEVTAAVPNVEREEAYTREVGFESMTVKLTGR
ncbi:MAG: hypothetical protein R3242_03760 [Akkermansiaceae bacterium]|nr:hypothetical protein [Akkermansiaceae bacterium]